MATHQNYKKAEEIVECDLDKIEYIKLETITMAVRKKNGQNKPGDCHLTSEMEGNTLHTKFVDYVESIDRDKDKRRFIVVQKVKMLKINSDCVHIQFIRMDSDNQGEWPAGFSPGDFDKY